ncbi:MAG: type II secretion system protein [Lachnospiraceae bacterium]|nr:type II secretion system protein [Lachnospiraceae bacterium]
MKIMNKLQNRKEELKKNNKGFSLVELIIVIAIMAILVGVVGTQVIPYINKSKESKDFQIVSSFGTAAMTAYSSKADKITVPTPASGDSTITFNLYASTAADTTDEGILVAAIKELTYSTKTDVIGTNGKFKSTEGKKIDDIKITYNFTKKTITAQAVDSSDNAVLGAVVSDM